MKTVAADGPGLVAPRETAPARAPREMDGADMARLFYTSAITGQPKGAMVSATNLASMTLCNSVDIDTVKADGVALEAAPMSHGARLCNFMHVLRGAAHALPKAAASMRTGS